ncbi:carph-isopro domain-containing protein [Sphingomonas sp. OK281]|uniref:carph-isopro domain-containing protein n=1 Tax=Sphingomonas sp. OK281 TaxID=1881067 RepID=UPI0011141C75|nr:hypothetical protein [Sphingomonas sp. OK281]
MSIRTIIARFGGIQPMAKKLGHRNHTTVQGWWERQTIPAHRFREVMAAARVNNLAVTVEELVPSGIERAA